MTKKQRERVAEIVEELNELCDSEETKLTNLPEPLQTSVVADRLQEGIDALSAAISELELIVTP